MSRQLLKSTAIVGSMTMVSRIMGFVRDMLIARIFGVDAATDAFFVAFKIPNFLRRLFAEGAFAQAFVPILTDYNENNNPQDLKQFIDKAAGTLSLILMLVTIIGTLGAPVLIMLFAPGFDWHSGQYELAVQMLRITFPYLFFISLVAFAGSVLNSHGKFAVSALTPVILNLCMIVAAVWIAPLMPEPVLALAWSVFFAGIIQLFFQYPALMRLKLLPRLRYGFSDVAVKSLLKLMLPAILGVSVTQLNFLVDTLFASFLTAGSVSWLYYSERLVEFPLGILGVAVGTVILPSLAKSHASINTEAFSHSLDWGLRLVLLIGAPATVGLICLAEPMLSSLFQYKEFGISDVQSASKSLSAYALGLLGFMLIKILAPGFTARKDTKTPLHYALYAAVAHLGMNFIFLLPLTHAGLALSTSLAAFINAALLFIRLLKDKLYKPSKGWRLFLVKLFMANLIMALVFYYGIDKTAWYYWTASERLFHLGLWMAAGGLSYFLALLLLGFRTRHLFVTAATIIE